MGINAGDVEVDADDVRMDVNDVRAEAEAEGRGVGDSRARAVTTVLALIWVWISGGAGDGPEPSRTTARKCVSYISGNKRGCQDLRVGRRSLTFEPWTPSQYLASSNVEKD